MSHDARVPIGYVEAVVRFPLFEGDKTETPWDWFEYSEPGITKHGHLGVCMRKCETRSARVYLESGEK